MSKNLSEIEPSCMSMAGMFLSKLIDSGILEHRQRTDAAMRSWQNHLYQNKETEQKCYFLCDIPDPMYWEKI